MRFSLWMIPTSLLIGTCCQFFQINPSSAELPVEYKVTQVETSPTLLARASYLYAVRKRGNYRNE